MKSVETLKEQLKKYKYVSSEPTFYEQGMNIAIDIAIAEINLFNLSQDDDEYVRVHMLKKD